MTIQRIRAYTQTILLATTAFVGIVTGIAGILDAIPTWLTATEHITLIVVGVIGFDLLLWQVSTDTRLSKLDDTDTQRKIHELPQDDRTAVHAAVASFVSLYQLRRQSSELNPKFNRICGEILGEQAAGLHGLARGTLVVPTNQLSLAQRRLLCHYHTSFEAVSEDDLKFWMTVESDAYYREMLYAITEYRIKISRIFVLKRWDIIHQPEQVASVLARQQKNGIAWGLAIAEEMDADIEESQLPIDFAMFDGGQAISFFRKTQPRRFEAIFRTSQTQERISSQQQLFERIVGECWLASSEFKTRYPSELSDFGKAVVKEKSERSNSEVRRLLGREPGVEAQPYFFLTGEHTEILSAVKQLGTLASELQRQRLLSHQ